MRIGIISRTTVAASLITTFVAGCGAASSGVPANLMNDTNPARASATSSPYVGRTSPEANSRGTRLPNRSLRHDSSALLFAVDSGLNGPRNPNVDIYSQAENKLVAQIKPGFDVSAIAVDNSGSLYAAALAGSEVCPFGGRKWGVLVFPAGSTKASMFLPAPTCDALFGVAVDDSGDVAITSGANYVAVYPPKSTSRCALVSGNPRGPQMERASFDKNGNLFVVGQRSYQGGRATIYEMEGGCRAHEIIDLGLTNLVSPQSVQIDNNGDISVLDAQDNPHIDVFEPGQEVASRVLTLTSSYQVYDFAFEQSGTTLWVSNDFPSKGVQQYSYDGSGKKMAEIRFTRSSFLDSVATFPVERGP